MELVPAGKEDVVKVAVWDEEGEVDWSRELSATVPSKVLPSMNDTVPRGTKNMPSGFTVAVKVTLPPTATGEADGETVVVGFARTTCTSVVLPAA